MSNKNIKFGIRFGNSRRGRIIRGVTVVDYLKSIGLTPVVVCPNGGTAQHNGQGNYIEFGLTIYTK